MVDHHRGYTATVLVLFDGASLSVRWYDGSLTNVIRNNPVVIRHAMHTADQPNDAKHAYVTPFDPSRRHTRAEYGLGHSTPYTGNVIQGDIRCAQQCHTVDAPTS